MSLLTLDAASLAFGHKQLLDRASLSIELRERVCLVGRNGSGKSTLLEVMSGNLTPDDGNVWRQDGLRIGHLRQDVPQDVSGTVYQTVAAGLPELGRVLSEYHDLSHSIVSGDEAALRRLSDLQHRIDSLGGWNLAQRVETVLTRLVLPADQPFSVCSGGVRRRVMLAQALVSEPDLLLLDEPTNHLDIEAITALEALILGFPGTVVFITHDRTMVRRLATRIVELDRGQLVSFPGNYDDYLRRKEEMLEIEARENAKFDKFLAEEEVWIRQGIKARRTRNEGRVRRLEALREARRQRVGRHGTVRLDRDGGSRSGQIVADFDRVTFGYGEEPLVRDLTMTVRRGDRIGIIGPNGCGKSTLLKLMLGELTPSRGAITLGTQLEVAYFDQQRAQLDPEGTVRENVSPGSDHVTIGDRRRHVIGYLGDFLFPRERTNSPVSSLSGGERNRLLLAKLFTQPANLLVLDEPTNDLDTETLELLESLLAEFTGTLLLVSHDRAFIDNVVTSLLAWEGGGVWREYVGGYQDWLRQRPALATAAELTAAPRTAIAPSSAPRKRLSYREQRELEALPGLIETLEGKQRDIERAIAEPAFYKQDKVVIAATMTALEAVSAELAAAFVRWESLEEGGRG
jgi:ATP-binding cassette subfamily F protein uup